MDAGLAPKELETMHLKAGRLIALGNLRVRNTTEGGLRLRLGSDGTLEISECCLDGEDEVSP
ncbi:MAG TPA: hypothetical protein VI893_05220 [Thermoplasmata archaeon]|nr:hypothetical protein [Thermoplasmata archaeon]